MDAKLKLILLLSLFLINPASAKFICGEVIPTDQISPAWYDVESYLKANPTYSSTCKVSPSNNKYCCDIDIILDRGGYQWKISDIFETKITDPASGYFAPPKNLTLTGEGYDITPPLTLQKAMKITFPTSLLTLSNHSLNATLNVSTSCSESNAPNSTPLTFGENSLSFFAICNEEEFTLDETFFIIKNITFQKKYSNFGNNPNNPKIRRKETGTITLLGNLSSPVENIPLKEYIPSSWELLEISNNGIIEPSTSEYNLITWEVTGENFNVSYKTKAPNVGFWPKNFIFKTQIDKHNLSEEEVQVYKIIPIPFIPKSSGGGFTYTPKQLSKVSPEYPLIFEEDSLTSALYSTTPKEEAAFTLLDFLYDGKIDRRFDLLKSYQIQTNLNSSEKGKIVFEYKINKSLITERDYKEIGFFERHKDKFLKITGGVISIDGDIIKYRFESENPPSEIFILAEKNSITFWAKILNLWDKIRFW